MTKPIRDLNGNVVIIFPFEYGAERSKKDAAEMARKELGGEVELIQSWVEPPPSYSWGYRFGKRQPARP